MSKCRLAAGDIVLIPFPFTDYSTLKLRPALVLSVGEFNNAAEDVVLAAISSKVKRNSAYDVVIGEGDTGFEKTGLKRSSAIRCGKIFTFSQRQMKRRLGELPAYHLTLCKSLLARLFGITSDAIGGE